MSWTHGDQDHDDVDDYGDNNNYDDDDYDKSNLELLDGRLVVPASGRPIWLGIDMSD